MCVCVCVCGGGVVGGGRRGVSVRGSRGGACAGAYFLMGLRLCRGLFFNGVAGLWFCGTVQ